MRFLNRMSLLIIGLLAVTPAQAAAISYTYTGIVQSGLDVLGSFGAVGADLTGERFSLVEIFDPSKAYVFPSFLPFSGQNGGALSGKAGSASAALTIGSGPAHVIEDSMDSVVSYAGSYNSTSVSHAITPTLSETIGFTTYAADVPFAYTQPITLSGPDVRSIGTYTVVDFSALRFASLQLTGQTLVVAAVPLPAGLPLFATGLLALGGIMALGRRSTAKV